MNTNTPGAADARKTLNELLSNFARTCAFGEDANARMAASKAIHEHVAALSAPASVAGAPSEQRGEIPIAPDVCPITRRKFWGNMEHPERGMVALYGGPYDSFTIPEWCEDDELRSERYDQDAGEWVEGGEPVAHIYAEQQAAPSAAAPSAATGAIDAREQEARNIVPKGDLSKVWHAADEVCEWLNYEAPENSASLLKTIETLNEEMMRAEIRASRAALASQDEAPAPSAASAQAVSPEELFNLAQQSGAYTSAQMNPGATLVFTLPDLVKFVAALATQQAVLADAPSAVALKAERDAGFNAGTVAALAILSLHDSEVQWREVLSQAGESQVLYYAAHVEPEDWNWGGFARYKLKKPRAMLKAATGVSK